MREGERERERKGWGGGGGGGGGEEEKIKGPTHPSVVENGAESLSFSLTSDIRHSQTIQ